MLERATTVAQELTNCNDPKCFGNLPSPNADQAQLQNLLAIAFGVIGAIAVVVIILASINLATSEGNPENISKAKRSIIFALIGLVIALCAEAIVFVVVGRL